jgi:hypothetical protein
MSKLESFNLQNIYSALVLFERSCQFIKDNGENLLVQPVI